MFSISSRPQSTIKKDNRSFHFCIPRAWHRRCQSMLIDLKEGREEGC